MSPSDGRESAPRRATRRQSAAPGFAATRVAEAALPSAEEIARRDRDQDVWLKRVYASWLLRALVGQLVIADAVFVLYAWLGRDWRLSTAVVGSWLAATLLEVVGVVYVVTGHLFPSRDGPAPV